MDDDAAVALADPDAIPDDVPTEYTYSLLADRNRQVLLSSLGELDTSERLSALTRTVAMKKDDESADPEWIRARLHHVHVPKLEVAGLAAYDREEHTVELTAAGEAVAAALER